MAESIEDILRDAMARHAGGDAAAAGRLARRVLERDADNGAALQIAGIAAAEAGEHDAALGYLDRALRTVPENSPGRAMLLLNMGEVCRGAGRLTDAAGHYAAAAMADPSSVIAHLSAGHATLNAAGDGNRDGDAKRALAHFRRAHALAAADAEADAEVRAGLARGLEAAGIAAMRARRPRHAAALFGEWLALQPDDPSALIDLGHALRDTGDLDGAVDRYRRALAARRGPGAVPDESLPTFHQTAAFKLRHDAEQFDHLAVLGRLPADLAGMADIYREIADALPPSTDRQRVFALTDEQRRVIGSAYNRFRVEGAGERLDGPAVNPDLDRAAIEAAYMAPEGGTEVTTIDGLLTRPALAALTDYCLETTFWFDFFHAGGYLGAYLEDGFDCPLLRQIVEELPRVLPGIFAGHRLRQMWAYKYDSRLTGIPMHADEARVNLNFWITPDDANLDSESGGLIVYPREAPLDWDFDTFNNDQAAIGAFIADSRPVEVPYRRNRAVVFDSDYFHRTGDLHFRPGYANRRINVTMLFGWRDGFTPTD